MIMDEKKQPGINFDGILLKDLSFSREPKILQKPSLDLTFNSNSTIEKDVLIYELSCSITEKEKTFNISCSMIGFFSVIPDERNMSLEDFSKTNAPAMMFPYIREVIASTTLKAGLAAVILPPVNINSLIKKSESASPAKVK